jgi:hypothetical protein
MVNGALKELRLGALLPFVNQENAGRADPLGEMGVSVYNSLAC